MKKHENVTIHRTYEKHEKTQGRDLVLYVARRTPLRGIEKIQQWVKSLPTKSTIRTTTGDSCDPLLFRLAEAGHEVRYAHWHATGIEKGQAPQEIVESFAAVPEDIFRPLIIRGDLKDLKSLVDQRNIFVEERTRAVQRIRALARSEGLISDVQYDESTNELLAEARSIRGRTKNGGTVNIVTDLERAISEAATKVPECVLLNRVAGISDSWILAAEIVVLFRGLNAFANVAKAWKFAGHAVEDGKAPKRAKGKVIGHNPRLLTVLWQLGSVLMMQRKEPWRSLFEQYREQELAAHDQKHPGCKTKQGHSTARALRRMRKEFLKQWFLEVKRSQQSNESHARSAPLGVGQPNLDIRPGSASATNSRGHTHCDVRAAAASDGRDHSALESHSLRVTAKSSRRQVTIEARNLHASRSRGERTMVHVKPISAASLAAELSQGEKAS